MEKKKDEQQQQQVEAVEIVYPPEADLKGTIT